MRRLYGWHVDAVVGIEQHVTVERDASAVGAQQPGDGRDHACVLPAPEAPNSAVDAAIA